MTPTTVNQLLNTILAGTVRNAVNGFLLDRRAQGLSPKTLRAYSQELGYFCAWLDGQGVIQIEELSAESIRLYLVGLTERRNPGGVHVAYRVIKTFTFWWEQETDGTYQSPIRKVKPPKLKDTPLDPADLDHLAAMLETCDSSPLGLRDRAILLALLDTGARAAEFCAIDLEDLNLITGAIEIQKGKGGKSRTVFLGKKARQALRAYLRARQDECPALWVTDDGQRLTYAGLRQIVRRRAAAAGVETPSLHSFRRAFALQMLRAGVSPVIIQDLLGHADMQVLRRYLKLTENDLRAAHQMGAPSDKLTFGGKKHDR